MIKYIALLRGINVGGNNKIAMPRLKKSFESMGFVNVRTYINSGNVLFETNEKDVDKLISKIEECLMRDFHLPLRVVLRDSDNIQKLCKQIPSGWKNDSDQRTDILFLWDDFDSKKSIELLNINSEVDNVKYITGAIVWNLKRSDLNKSGMRKFIGTEIYKNMTARNINTLRKINELMNKK